jgi:hypothetical protein
VFIASIESSIGVMFYIVRFEDFTAVTIKNFDFWDVAPCRSCVNQRFGEIYHLHLQGRKFRERGTSMSRWLQTAVYIEIVYITGYRSQKRFTKFCNLILPSLYRWKCLKKRTSVDYYFLNDANERQYLRGVSVLLLAFWLPETSV